MEHAGPETLSVRIAFTALRLEFGWLKTPITSTNLAHLNYNKGSVQFGACWVSEIR